MNSRRVKYHSAHQWQHIHNEGQRNVHELRAVIVRILVGSNSSHHPLSCCHITRYDVLGGYTSLPIQRDLIRSAAGAAETNIQICRITDCRREFKGESISGVNRGGMKGGCGVVVEAGQEEIPVKQIR